MPTIVFLLIVLLGGVAAAKDNDGASKEESAKKTAKLSLINESKAIGFIRERLESSTGLRGWQVKLRETTASGKDFVATRQDRTERGSVNMRANYPNDGMLRVYLIPHD